MKKIHLFIALVAVSLLGCHKSPPAAPPPAADATPPPVDANGQPVEPLPPPTTAVTANAENAVQAAVTGVVDPFLTSQLQVFIQQKGRMPGSFMEFAHARLDSIPRPPEGKKWAIDNTTGQVKSVPK